MDVKSAGRVLDIFEAFSDLKAPAPVKRLADYMQIPVSSCFNLVRTIEHRGYLYTTDQSGVYPTRRLLHLARNIAANEPVAARVSPHLSALCDITGESTCLAQLRGLQAVYLDVYESRQEVRYCIQSGETRDLQTNSMGKAILASVSGDQREAILHRLKKMLSSATKPWTGNELRRDLGEGRKRGWYTSYGAKTLTDAFGIAMPLQIGEEWYAICVAGPRFRMEPLLNRHVTALRGTVDQICREGSPV